VLKKGRVKEGREEEDRSKLIGISNEGKNRSKKVKKN
jgi:hypothetical protein